MTSTCGKTGSGFTYEAEYDYANDNRVDWTATYRRDGTFFGMRHGRINQLSGLSLNEVDEAVKKAIEQTWG